MRFRFKFNVNGMVQDCKKMSYLSGEQAEDSTAKRSAKIVTLATKYTKYEIHFNVCERCQNILCTALYLGFASFFLQLQF